MRAAIRCRVFRHGVASGDPLADRVMIWTRVSPFEPDATTAVEWDVASDPGFGAVVMSGTARAAPSRDHTVHVDVANPSAVGRTWDGRLPDQVRPHGLSSPFRVHLPS